MIFGVNILLVLFVWLAMLLVLIISYALAYRKYKKALAMYDPKLKETLDSMEEELAYTPVYDDGVEDSFASLFVFITPRALLPLPIWLYESNREIKAAAAIHAGLVYITWLWIALVCVAYWLYDHNFI